MNAPQPSFWLDRRQACALGIWAATLASLSTVWPHALLAQHAGDSEDAIRVGDRWTFDTKDEITGLPKDTVTRVVTEINPNEIVVSVTNRGKNGSSLIVYDHDWNVLENSNAKFKPNDGQGIQRPLVVGKEWRSDHETRNVRTGSVAKTSVASKVTAEEMITTSAGTFATFKIESKRREINATDPSRSWDYENVGWYAPQINFWVRRTYLTRVQKRMTANTSQELVEFGRKL